MTIKFADAVTTLNISKDGKKLLVATKDNLIRVFNTSTGIEITALHGHSNWYETIIYQKNISIPLTLFNLSPLIFAYKKDYVLRILT